MPVLTKDEEIKKVLEESKTVAVIGISPTPSKPSYFVSEVVKRCGYKMYFVNPKYEGQTILGEKVYKSIKDIPDEIDIVDVFRRPADVPYTVKEAKEKGFKTLWLQPGTVNPQVVDELSKEGYNVIAGKCMKVECLKFQK